MNRILFDCERMRKPYIGLYYYNFHLATHLIETCAQEEDIHFLFYVNQLQKGIFGHSPYHDYLRQHAWHKCLLPHPKQLAIWHCTHQSSDYFPFGRSRKHKKVLTVHDINFMYDDRKSDLKKKKYADNVKRQIEEADHVIVVSAFTKNDLLKHHLVEEGKPMSVIYNSHCLTETHLPSTFSPAFVPPKPFLFSIGTIMRKKNFHVLPSLLEGNDLHLVIAGVVLDEEYLNEIQQEIVKWKVEKRVTILPPISEQEKIWYYQHCKAFLFLSLSEGFGIPVIEAMSFGKPVLLSRCTSLPEIGGKFAFYVDHFDPTHMKERLQQGLEQYENTPSMQKDIIAHSQQFSWTTAAKEHMKVYRSLL